MLNDKAKRIITSICSVAMLLKSKICMCFEKDFLCPFSKILIDFSLRLTVKHVLLIYCYMIHCGVDNGISLIATLNLYYSFPIVLLNI